MHFQVDSEEGGYVTTSCYSAGLLAINTPLLLFISPQIPLNLMILVSVVSVQRHLKS